jgi:phosphoribosylformimino-5-aminoimidazole carboxamide ribotide isomerase
MIILPAIDIKAGTCVRLFKGDFDTAEKVADNAHATAQRFYEAGARWLHIVDLDGAKTGGRPNRGLILDVVKASGLKAEVGGGIRDMESVADYLQNGASRVILGSAALSKPEFVKEAACLFGDRIAVGIDAKKGLVATHGWLETSSVPYLDFAKSIEAAGIKTIIFTDIDCDGTLGGPDFEQLEKLQKAVGRNIIASGGIRDIGHIEKLAGMGLYGAICGKSVYSGTLDLTAAIKTGGRQDAC